MRVIAGTHRGRRLKAPRGRGTRPTADRVREAVFSAIGPVGGADVLDLFAGSGAMGIEALSRGARAATFVERDPQAAAVIRSNLGMLGLEPESRVLVEDWRSALVREARRGARYDLCVVDPPYSVLAGISGSLSRALAPVLAECATVIVEGSAEGPAPTMDGIRVTDRSDRTYGSTRVTIFRTDARGDRA